MSRLRIDLNVASDDLTGTALDDGGRTWPIEGWLSLIGIIDRTRRDEHVDGHDQQHGPHRT